MLQMVDVAYPGAVEASLEHSADFIVDFIEIWGTGLPHLACFQVKNIAPSLELVIVYTQLF